MCRKRVNIGFVQFAGRKKGHAKFFEKRDCKHIERGERAVGLMCDIQRSVGLTGGGGKM